MSGLLKKRSREDEALPNSPKRFHGGTELQILDLLEDIEGVHKIQGEEAERGAVKEVVSGVMRSLGEEIGVTSCDTSYQGSELSSDTSLASDKISGYGTCEGEIDLDYLLGASDVELGIPPSPVLSMEGQATSSLKEEVRGTCLEFVENAEYEGFLDNWHLEEDFVDCRQFAVFEDTAAAAWDGFSHDGAFIDGDYSAPWGLETVMACIEWKQFN